MIVENLRKVNHLSDVLKIKIENSPEFLLWISPTPVTFAGQAQSFWLIFEFWVHFNTDSYSGGAQKRTGDCGKKPRPCRDEEEESNGIYDIIKDTYNDDEDGYDEHDILSMPNLRCKTQCRTRSRVCRWSWTSWRRSTSVTRQAPRMS